MQVHHGASAHDAIREFTRAERICRSVRPRPRHSGLTWAARITLAHFSVSSARSLPNSAGLSANGVPPRSAKRALILGSARAAAISLLSLSTIAGGVFLGAPTPSQSPASKPGTNSLTVGTSGSAGERAAVVTASARSFPLLTCSIDPAIPANEITTCPPRRSAKAGPAPRYGLSAAGKRQPQQGVEKSVSRLCPGERFSGQPPAQRRPSLAVQVAGHR